MSEVGPQYHRSAESLVFLQGEGFRKAFTEYGIFWHFLEREDGNSGLLLFRISLGPSVAWSSGAFSLLIQLILTSLIISVKPASLLPKLTLSILLPHSQHVVGT